MDFKAGDMAVYPAHGVGIVEKIETKCFKDGKKESFYVLRILDTGITIMIPMGNAEQVGLRAIMDASAVRSVYKILKEREVELEPSRGTGGTGCTWKSSSPALPSISPKCCATCCS